MATYKLIQDIEAEDHILGPLTLRQFIFALIAAFFMYISFLLFTKGLVIIDVFFLPPGIFFGFFAVPFGKDQPTEIWALAKLRFYLKPRKRIWDQSGIKELVTITVPKRIDKQLTDGLTQHEVKSRLRVLADTLDTRGWAIKNSSSPTIFTPFQNPNSDRLIDLDASDRVIDNSIDENDILDESKSYVAQQFTQMINESTKNHHQQLVEAMNSPATEVNKNEPDGWFMPTYSQNSSDYDNSNLMESEISSKQKEKEEEFELSKRLKSQQVSKSLQSNNLRTLSPLDKQDTTSNISSHNLYDHTASAKLTSTIDPDIIALASSNLPVQTIAREAKKIKGEDLNKDEVIISLH
jgi:hypothetical protein